MDANEAIDILRSKEGIQIMGHRTIARDMGAQALEAWAWVERMEAPPERLGDGWICSHYSPTRGYIAGTGMTPLAAVLDPMKKEGKGNG